MACPTNASCWFPSRTSARLAGLEPGIQPQIGDASRLLTQTARSLAFAASLLELARGYSLSLPPRRDGFRAGDQRRDFPRLQLAVEAQAQHAGVLPSNDRPAAERSAIQHHARSGCQACRAIELRTAGGEVENADEMPLAIGLKERRQRYLDPRIGPAVRIGRGVFGGGDDASHVLPVAKA